MVNFLFSQVNASPLYAKSRLGKRVKKTSRIANVFSVEAASARCGFAYNGFERRNCELRKDFKNIIMRINKMVLFSTNVLKFRICIRNQYSDNFNDFDILRLGKTSYIERIEYKFGLIGIQFCLMFLKD